MPPGRRAWVFENTRVRLGAGRERLSALCRVGADAEAALLRQMLEFKTGQRAPDATRVWPREVLDLDVALDRRVGVAHNLIRSMADVYAGAPSGPAWSALILAAFPEGATYYTAVPYVEEAARVGVLLEVLGEARWAPLLADGGVAQAVADVRAAHASYAAAVSRFDRADKVGWDDVKARDLANHQRLCVLIAGIVHELADDATARAAALEPCAHQDHEIFQLLRARRAVLDVDPTSGEPIAPVPPGPPGPPGLDDPTPTA